jgi:hypothetical protein
VTATPAVQSNAVQPPVYAKDDVRIDLTTTEIIIIDKQEVIARFANYGKGSLEREYMFAELTKLGREPFIEYAKELRTLKTKYNL